MSKTITAKFTSIDAATNAASNAKDRCENISSVKVKYKTENDSDNYNFNNGFEPYSFIGAAGFAPVDASTPALMQNGIFPVAVNVDPLYDSRGARTKNATVEITVNGGNVDPICSTLRQGGGIALKVR